MNATLAPSFDSPLDLPLDLPEDVTEDVTEDSQDDLHENPRENSKENTKGNLRSAKGLDKAPTKSSGKQENSLITGIIDEKLVVIDFGKYEGKTVFEMSQLDAEYYDRLVSQRESGAYAIRRNKDKTFYLYINPLSKMDH